jgi:chemotaxis protein CheC
MHALKPWPALTPSARGRSAQATLKRQAMHGDIETRFSDEERDILQEVMNIAFGRASADLAEVIDIYVVLSVPNIRVLDASEIPRYIVEQVKAYERISLVEQVFLGKFRGMAMLIFPAGAGRDLLALLDSSDGDRTSGAENMALLERETLMEIANILIGACVGKVAELLHDVVTYSPPRVAVGDTPREAAPAKLFDAYGTAILMKTVFGFEKQDISGFLFLLTNDESIDWLKTALHQFLESYG